MLVSVVAAQSLSDVTRGNEYYCRCGTNGFKSDGEAESG